MDNARRQTRSGSSGQLVTIDDIKAVVQESEARVVKRLDDIVSRITQLEDRFNSIQVEQARLDLELTSVKEIIVDQQKLIEKHEVESRQMNLIFNSVPETDVKIEDGFALNNDIAKIKYLCQEISDDFDDEDIESCVRLGRAANNRTRPIKVKFTKRSPRNLILYSQKKIRDNRNVVNSFGTVYINKDSSLLLRKEEKRLRDRMIDERAKSPPHTTFAIRSGKLYRNSILIDQVDIANQLF